MINILSSKAETPNSAFQPKGREKGENNIKWLERNLPADGPQTHLLLVGGKSPTSFRLRVAQSQLKHDMTPSHWSHVLLLEKKEKELSSTKVYEISLEPEGGFGFPSPSNGLQTSTLQTYRDPRRFPNIALLSIPVSQDKVMTALDGFQYQRSVLDALELTLVWLGYVWGASRAGNPLLNGQGIPSAAMLEVVFSAAGYDLTPGLESRASCPEAIWQAARWWHDFYTSENRPGISGAYSFTHVLLENE